MNKTNLYKHQSSNVCLSVCMFTPKTFYNLSAHLLHQYFYGIFIKRKGYPLDQKLDVLEKNRGHFWTHRPNISQKCARSTSAKLCSPVLHVLLEAHIHLLKPITLYMCKRVEIASFFDSLRTCASMLQVLVRPV